MLWLAQGTRWSRSSETYIRPGKKETGMPAPRGQGVLSLTARDLPGIEDGGCDYCEILERRVSPEALDLELDVIALN